MPVLTPEEYTKKTTGYTTATDMLKNLVSTGKADPSVLNNIPTAASPAPAAPMAAPAAPMAAPAAPAKSYGDYVKDATSMYDPTYNQRVAQAQSGFSSQIAGYDNQINGVNNNFAKDVESNKRNVALNQNQYNNNTLSRGMARSSIATTGLAGIGNTGNRIEGELTAAKNSQIADIENLKATLRQNLKNTLENMALDRGTGINQLAMQLKDRADAKDQTNFNNEIAVAGLTGTYKGEQTMQGKTSEATLESTKESIKGQKLQNSYQELLNKGLPEKIAAELAEVQARTKEITLSNEAKEIANKYADEIAKGQLDGVLLQNAYQTMINNGYPAEHAAKIAQSVASANASNASAAANIAEANNKNSGGLTTKELLAREDKEYDSYLDIGKSMRNATVKDSRGNESSKYNDKQIYDWVMAQGLSDAMTAKLLNALNIPETLKDEISNLDGSDEYYDPYNITTSKGKLNKK